jgi:SAM-dependent methyltransferase
MHTGTESPQPIVFDEIADLYDAYVTVDFDVPFFLDEAHRSGGRVLELTSGTGRVSLPLLQAGIDLTCVDYSAKMLAILRNKLERHGLSCTIVQSDIAELDLRTTFDLIFIPFNSFSEILDRRRHVRALRRIRAHLANGGRFLCTLQNPAVRAAQMDGTLRTIGEFPFGRGGTLTVRSALRYDLASHIGRGTQEYEVRDADGREIERRSLPVIFRLFEENEFRTLAAAEGYAVHSLFGNYDRSPFDAATSPFMLWTLTAQEAGSSD